jgi:hypothetical protein
MFEDSQLELALSFRLLIFGFSSANSQRALVHLSGNIERYKLVLLKTKYNAIKLRYPLIWSLS